MLSGIVGAIIGILGVLAGIFALLSNELDKNKKLKYAVVGVLFAFAIYALFGSVLALDNAESPTNQTIRSTVPIAIDATKDWQETGFIAARGDIIKVRVIGGKWTTARRPFPSDIRPQLPENIRGLEMWINYTYESSGDGSGLSCNECPMPTLPVGVLVGRIDNMDPFAIGSATTFTASQSGALYLRINDGRKEGTANLDDNGGILAVEITVQK
jgi:hypothetical protein